MRENTDQKKSEYGHFLRSEIVTKISSNLRGVKLLSRNTSKSLGQKFYAVFSDMKKLILPRKLETEGTLLQHIH